MKLLPTAFTARMKSLLGDDYAAFEQAINGEPVKAFRVNTEKISVEDFKKIDCFSCGSIPYCETGFYTKCEKPGNHPYHHAGIIYVQEPAAMAPAQCLEIDPDWYVLDMCAAPGGKSTQLKNKLGDKGLLVSNEIIPNRCRILTGNIERLGLKNTVTTCMDTARLAQVFPETFDMIMVDAPCSGEGMFRKDDTAIAEWSEENVLKCAARQAEILENAVKCLKKDGYIIYATCTFSLEENEMVVDAFLTAHPEFSLVPVNPKVSACTADGICFKDCRHSNISLTRRFYPHKCPGEGQFMAVLYRKGEKTAAYKKEQKSVVPDRTVFDFLDDVLEDYERDAVKTYGDTPVYFGGDLEIKKGTAFSCGVTIGEVVKNRIVPHHQFFMALGNRFKRKIDLDPDGEEIMRYLHGEEIDTPCRNGWAVITVRGCSLGGVKVVDGRAKNHYPKGLRMK